MQNYSENNPAGHFVRNTILWSLTAVMILLNAGDVLAKNADSILAGIVESKASGGNYASALDILDSISSEDVVIESKYFLANTMLADGYFNEASDIFLELDNYLDSEDGYLKCQYALADEKFNAGDYDGALELFTILGVYSDASDRVNTIVYRKAEKAVSDGDFAQAVLLFGSLGEYGDAAERAYEAAFLATGDEQMALDMLSSDGMTEEELGVSVQITKKRSIFPESRIAAGNYHTVILHDDGTVSAYGDNSAGQCNVDTWSDIVAVYAGARHTVGLKSNGSVVAVGSNNFGQCKVNGWKNISMLAVGSNDTVALRSDGKILFSGYGDFSVLERATDVAGIYAGSYAAVALTSNGTVISSHGSAALTPEGKLIDIQINTGYTMSLYNTGKCRISTDIGEEWNNMVCIDAGANGMIGADVEGNIRSHFFRDADKIDFSSASGVCQCAAGTKHYVFLSEDGRLFAFGDNSYGQCNLPDRI